MQICSHLACDFTSFFLTHFTYLGPLWRAAVASAVRRSTLSYRLAAQIRVPTTQNPLRFRAKSDSDFCPQVGPEQRLTLCRQCWATLLPRDPASYDRDSRSSWVLNLPCPAGCQVDLPEGSKPWCSAAGRTPLLMEPENSAAGARLYGVDAIACGHSNSQRQLWVLYKPPCHWSAPCHSDIKASPVPSSLTRTSS